MRQRVKHFRHGVNIDFSRLVHDPGPKFVDQFVALLLVVRIKCRQDGYGVANLSTKKKPFPVTFSTHSVKDPSKKWAPSIVEFEAGDKELPEPG